MTVNIPEGYGIARFIWICSGDSQPMYATTGFAGDSTRTAADFTNEAYASFLAGFPSANFLDLYTYKGVNVSFHNVLGMTNAVKLVDVIGGSASSKPMPSNCAMLIRKNTGYSSRSQRGRMFVPPLMTNEDQVDQNGFINSGSFSALVPRVNSWYADFVSGPNILTARVLHSNPALTPTPVNSWDLQVQVATQRQRMRK